MPEYMKMFYGVWLKDTRLWNQEQLLSEETNQINHCTYRSALEDMQEYWSIIQHLFIHQNGSNKKSNMKYVLIMALSESGMSV